MAEERRSYGSVSVSNHNRDDEENDEEYDDKEESVISNEGSDIFDFNENSSLFQQFLMILTCSLPTMLSLFMTLLSMTITMLFAGILTTRSQNNDIFAGISLAATFADVSFFSFLYGFLSATETLSSQRNGAKQYPEVGSTFYLSLLSLTLISIPLLLSWNYVSFFFAFIGVDSSICEITHRYLMIEIYASPGYLIVAVYETYLQSLGLMAPAMYSSILYNLLLITLLSISFFVFESPSSSSLSSYEVIALVHVVCTYLELIFILFLTYSTKEVTRTLIMPPIDDLKPQKILSFLSLGLSGCITTCSEWWAVEILILLSSSISPEALSSLTILVDLLILLLMIPMGIETTITSMIGNSLGSGSVTLVRSIGSLSYLLIFLIDLILSPLVYYYGMVYVHLFSSDPVVLKMTQSCLLLLSLQLFLDGFLSISYGILIAMGKQSLCSLVTVSSYLLLIIPLGWYLGIEHQLGISGLLGGLMIGSSLEALAMAGIVFYFCRLSSPLQASFAKLPLSTRVTGASSASVDGP
jgi:multidrug resistance protein, MATE family